MSEKPHGKKSKHIYLPSRDYDGNHYLEAGSIWQRQGHIYSSPFYYIDYTLAQICAFQFWKRSLEDHEELGKIICTYVSLVVLSLSQNLYAEANLISPFEDGCVESVIGTIEEWLNSVDDKAFKFAFNQWGFTAHMRDKYKRDRLKLLGSPVFLRFVLI